MISVTRLTEDEKNAVGVIAETLRSEATKLPASSEVAACFIATAVDFERVAGSVSVTALDPA